MALLAIGAIFVGLLGAGFYWALTRSPATNSKTKDFVRTNVINSSNANQHNNSKTEEPDLLLPNRPSGQSNQASEDFMRFIKGLTPARVVYRNPLKDLAIIELLNVPDNVHPVAVARKPADIGAKVYSIGNSSIANNEIVFEAKYTLWRLTTGNVRLRAERRFFIPTLTGIATRSFMTLETDAPHNQGDSGGPIVNSRAELVALVSTGDLSQNNISLNVDISEIWTFVNSCYSRFNDEWDPPKANDR